MKAASYLIDTLEDPNAAHSSAADKSPFAKAFGHVGFDYYVNHVCPHLVTFLIF